jgi:epoxide hydrolase-like predicted phosphatase
MKKIDNVIFDLGGVLIRWDPRYIVSTYTNDLSLQNILLKEVFQHQDWLDLDRGIITEDKAAIKLSKRTGLSLNVFFDLFEVTKQCFIELSKTRELLKDMHSNGVMLYCLSNMSEESYAYLAKRYKFFDYFHGVVISGQEKLIKPDLAIFKLICERYDLQPEKTLFIDDMNDNIVAAKSCGLNAIQFTYDDPCNKLIRDFIR